ncbi:hypothetical protein ACFFRR_007783 [Megaselia abdita]
MFSSKKLFPFEEEFGRGIPVTRKLSLQENSTIPLRALRGPILRLNSTSTPQLNYDEVKKKLKPGLVLVFNQMNFDIEELSTRTGSDKDVEAIEDTFAKFNMPVTVKKDKRRKDIQRIMKDMAKKNFEKYACIVVILLSHGRMNDMIAARDGWFRIHDLITSPLYKNKTLRSKPKLVFVQACKGNKTMNVYSDNIWFEEEGHPTEMLQFYSTYEGFLSYRTDKGSYFIQTLCFAIASYGDTKDISEIVDIVIKGFRDNYAKQIPTVTTNLTQRLVFGDYK